MKTSKKVLAIVLSVVMVLSAMVFSISAADFDETWKAVTNAEELKAIENDYYGKYYLANDITLADFEPIGWSDMNGDGSDDAFYGQFNGNGHTISGLTQDYGNATYAGLFAKNFGKIENLTFDNAYINAKDGVGVVAGVNRGTIENVTVQNSDVVTKAYSTNYDYTRSGLITGQNGTGGIIKNCMVKSCYIGGNIMVGGIAGSNLGTIQGCTADDIRINSKTKNNEAQISGIYNLGAKCLINQGYYRYYCIGGLVGNNQGTLTECEVVTNAIVYGFQSVGGLVGYNSGTVTKCWFGVPDSVKDIPYYEVYNYPSDRNPQYTLYAEDTNWDIGENEAGATAEDIYGIDEGTGHEHVFTTWTVVKEATCTEAGLKTSVCDICGAKASEVIPATGHVDKNNDKKCDVCGADVDCHKHVDANDNGFCDDCGENICEHASTTVVDAKAATCEEAGYTGNKVCDKCGKTIEKGTEIPAKGHVDKNNDKKCDVCGADVDCHKHVDANDNGFCDDCGENICEHASTTIKDAKAATCEEAGYTGNKVCDKCGKTIEKGTEIPAKGHVDKNNDKKCDVCGADVDCHSHVDADDNGFCDDCGENICEHASTTVVGAKDATCEEAGYTGDKVCDKCDEIIEKGTEIPAKGHDYQVVGKKDATCEEAGYTGDKVCDKCGKTTEKGTEIPAKGHNDANGDGKCDDCGKEIGGGSNNGGNTSGCRGFFEGLLNWFTRLMILVRHLVGMTK